MALFHFVGTGLQPRKPHAQSGQLCHLPTLRTVCQAVSESGGSLRT